MVQRIFIFLMASMIAYACASTKKVTDISIGTWDYVITGTPEGDLNGTFVIAKEGKVYSGMLQSTQGQIDLRNVVIEEKELKCDFDYMGYTVLMTGTFADNTFDGKVSVDYNDFMMKATKKL